MNLVGVSHLFVVPSIRTSHYVNMLSTAFPSILTAAPGEIQAEGLPNLKHLIVFDDIAASVPGRGAGSNIPSGLKPWQDTKAAIDLREIFLWN